jgi:hypothetical protein
MQKISWTDRVRNEAALQEVKEERNFLQKYKGGRITAFGHILLRNCFLKHVFEEKIEGMIEVTERRGRKCKQLLDDLTEKGGCWKLNEDALDLTLFRSRLVCLFIQLRTAALGLIVRSWLDVPTFATRRLQACHHARAASGGR